MSRSTKKIDLRVQKTYRQLESAFRTLALEKSLEDMTIQELCDAADIRRTTFYQHFEDKHDFLFWFLRRIQDQYLEQHPLESLNEKCLADCCVRCTEIMIAYLKENRRLIDALHSETLPEIAFLDSFYACYKDRLRQYLKDYCDEKGILPLFPLDMTASYYLGATVGSVIWWYKSSDLYREKNLLEDLGTMLRNSPRSLEDQALHMA